MWLTTRSVDETFSFGVSGTTERATAMFARRVERALALEVPARIDELRSGFQHVPLARATRTGNLLRQILHDSGRRLHQSMRTVRASRRFGPPRAVACYPVIVLQKRPSFALHFRPEAAASRPRSAPRARDWLGCTRLWSGCVMRRSQASIRRRKTP